MSKPQSRVIVLALLCCLTATMAAPKKLRIFILAGQSNMVGHSSFRTVPALLDDKDPGAQQVAELIIKKNAVSNTDVRAMIKTQHEVAALKATLANRAIKEADRLIAVADLQKREKELARHRRKVQGAFNVSERVYITSIADGNRRSGKLSFGYGGSKDKLGPELGFGMSLEKKIDGPILIIKTSWGGKSLHYDFRPPSAGVYPLDEKQKKSDDPEYIKQIARDKELCKVWLVNAEKAVKAFWVKHDKFMAKNLSKKLYAEWRKDVENWNRDGIEGNGGYANLQPWMVWALERKAQTYFTGTDIKAPVMNFQKTLWKERPKLAKALNGDQIRAGAGTFWRKMTTQVHTVLKDLKTYHPDYDAKAGYEMAGFVWFQGYNDQFSESYHSNYKDNMAAFIKDVRKEFGNPKMPFVIGVLGTAGTKEGTDKNAVSVAQRSAATLPEFKGTVKSVESYVFFDHKALGMWRDRTWKKPENLVEFQRLASDKPYHYMGSGKLFTRLGDSMAKAMAEMMKE